MQLIAAFLAVISFAFLARGAPAPKAHAPIYVDLQEKATHTLAEDSASGMAENNLAEVPTGEKEFGGIKFKIGKGYVQLGSPHFKTERPEKVEGIKVDAIVTRLHILHATCYGTGTEVKHVADDTVIAEYRVHYAGGDTHTIEVVYGKDVRDYWF